MKKNKTRLEEDDIDFLIDLLMDSNMSIAQIAKELDVPVAEVNKKINNLGLNWLKDSRKKMSRGQTALTNIMKKLLPGEEVINEYHIGDRLKLDVYCPKYSIAAEYHGRQHFYYTSRFFESRYDFIEAQKRDEKKVQYCKDNGIALVVFRYNDSLTEQSVYDRILEAIRNSSVADVKQEKKSVVNSSFYQEAKKKNSEYKKSLYRKLKDAKSNDKRRSY